ncbi:MAG: holo-ACP synthase [Anaerolineales bacterium]|jgi:holo-[acyl-carrier protein] synthase
MIRVGIDLVAIPRLEQALARWGSRFLERVFTAEELQNCGSRSQSLAARFAAKEAVAKALGTGLTAGVGWREIEIISGMGGQPQLRLHGEAHRQALQLGLEEWAVSLSHSGDQALAVVIARSKDGADAHA